jgi:hypothetical protein
MSDHMDNQIAAKRATGFANLLKACMYRYPQQRVGEIFVNAMRKYEEEHGDFGGPRLNRSEAMRAHDTHYIPDDLLKNALQYYSTAPVENTE